MRANPLSSGLITGLLACAFSVGSSAETVDGKANLICATEHVMACVEGAICERGTPQTFEMPIFMIVDVKRQVIRGMDDNGKEVASPIKAHEVTDNSFILQGFEAHQGWTMGIDRQDGSFTLSLTGPDLNFMNMGNCSAL